MHEKGTESLANFDVDISAVLMHVHHVGGVGFSEVTNVKGVSA